MQNGEHRGVKEALDRAGAYGPDVDLSQFNVGESDLEQIEDLQKVDADTKDLMVNVGVVSDENGRDGSIVFINNSMSHCSNKTEDGVELLSTKEAVAKYDWLKDYFWKAVEPEKDK
ncbi:MAG: SufD family Fe-S cluster assembly protein, partial [Candidatus Methanomethylophilaceae archaeon]|nr:SufD family Fe-S cluster assembly protein [Candidatus Methanomethylophilaceae archaeon]